MRFRRPLIISFVWVTSLSAFGASLTHAQAAKKGTVEFESLDALNAVYAQRLAELERRRLDDLAALARRKSGAEADAIYRDLFHLAIARGFVHEASAAADRCISDAKAAADVHGLAVLVTVISEADQRRFNEALDGLRTFLQRPPRAGAPDHGAEGTVLAVGEAFVRHLIRAGRYDFARKVCERIVAESSDPEVDAHFTARMRLPGLAGKAAPPIDAAGVDGERIRLSDHKGKVVLVVFWASWCPPCLSAFPALNDLAAKHAAHGFEVVGVNVDAHHQDIKDVKSAMPIVRHVLVQYGVTWPNVINDEGNDDIARAYGVEALPANVLIGRDGNVAGVEIDTPELESAISAALGRPIK